VKEREVKEKEAMLEDKQVMEKLKEKLDVEEKRRILEQENLKRDVSDNYGTTRKLQQEQLRKVEEEEKQLHQHLLKVYEKEDAKAAMKKQADEENRKLFCKQLRQQMKEKEILGSQLLLPY